MPSPRSSVATIHAGRRGRWTAAVAYEATRSARVLPAICKIASDGWLGEPIEVTDVADIRRINHVRRAAFGGTDNEPLKHLGEAETCFVILEWAEFAGSWWVSDDKDALRYARFRGITTRETIDLVGMAVLDGHIEASDGFDLMRRMASNGRRLRLPDSAAELRR
jgi:hypothetical protein